MYLSRIATFLLPLALSSSCLHAQAPRPAGEPARVPELSAPLKAYLQLAPSNGTYDAAATFAASKALRTAFSAAAEGPDHYAPAGLLADRVATQVIVLADASDMKAGEPIEFYVTSRESGYAYESIAVAHCKPSALHAALEFIGCEPGWPVDPPALRFWPRGDRVTVDVLHQHGGEIVATRIEDFAQEAQSTNRVARQGFIFVGSKRVPAPAADGEDSDTVYAADVFSPQAIVANYNLAETVLDLPRRAAQQQAYGQQLYARDTALKPGQPLALVFRKAAVQPREDLRLQVTGTDSASLRFHLTGLGDDDLKNADFTNLLATLQARVEAARECHVSLRFADSIQLAALQQCCHVIKQLNNESGIRVGPPDIGRLYFESFVPDERFRDRTQRPGQPWELHLKPDGGARFVDIQERFVSGKLDPELTVNESDLANPDAFAATVGALPARQALFMYAAPETPLGDIMAYARRVHERCEIFFVYQHAADPAP